jgi:hypothetical protein
MGHVSSLSPNFPGHAVSHVPNGTQTQYTQNGAQITKTQTTKGGVTTHQMVSNRNGIITTTTNTSQTVNKPISQAAPSVPGVPQLKGDHSPRALDWTQGAGAPPPSHGDTQITTSKQTVQNTNAPGSKATVVSNSTAYKQTTPDGRAYSVTHTSVANGQNVNTLQAGSTRTTPAAGSIPDGPASQTTSSLLTVQNGQPTNFTASQHQTGLTSANAAQTLAAQAHISPQYAQKYASKLTPPNYQGPMNSTSTQSINLRTGQVQSQYSLGASSTSMTPGSRTVTVNSATRSLGANGQFTKAPATQIDYRKVSGASNGAIRVQDQTNIVGSDAYQLDDTTYQKNGAYSGSNTVYAGPAGQGAPVSQVNFTHFQVGANAVHMPGGDGTSRAAFLNANGNGPLWETRTVSLQPGSNAAGNPFKNQAIQNQITFSAPGSGDSLSYRYTDPYATGNPAPGHPLSAAQRRPAVTTTLQEPGGQTPLRVTNPSGQSLQVNNDGSVTASAKDGFSLRLPGINPNDAATPAMAAADLPGWLSRNKSNPSLSQFQGPGGIMGLANQPGSALSALGGGGGLGTASSAAGWAGDAAKLLGKTNIATQLFGEGTSAAQLAGPVLDRTAQVVAPGAAGAFGLANGVNELENGNIAQGALDTASGLASGASAGAALLLPEEGLAGPVGWAAAALSVGSLILGLINGPPTPSPDRTAPLTF